MGTKKYSTVSSWLRANAFKHESRQAVVAEASRLFPSASAENIKRRLREYSRGGEAVPPPVSCKDHHIEQREERKSDDATAKSSILGYFSDMRGLLMKETDLREDIEISPARMKRMRDHLPENWVQITNGKYRGVVWGGAEEIEFIKQKEGV